MRVLLIAHYFPPDGGAGSQRPASFAQHFPSLGAEITVVCRQLDDGKRGVYEPADRTLVERTAQARIRRAVALDGETWTSALLREAREAVRVERPDIIVVTLSPFEHAEVGFAIQREFGIPVVLDLRDPWALDGWHTYRHHFQWRAALATMRHALESADGVVMNVPGARTAAETIAPRRGKLTYGVVTNGWEESDFAQTPDVPVSNKLRIRFAGTFVCRFMNDRSLLRQMRALLRGRGESIDERGRSPLYLLGALKWMRDEHFGPAAEDFMLEIAGAREAQTDEIIAESGCADSVRQVGYLPHNESARFISGADVLLLPMHGLRRGARARMVPGKLYEYLGTGRPILGLCPDGDARDWILRDPRSRVGYPTHVLSIARKLREMHAMWRNGEYVHSRRPEWVHEFSRRTQAQRMVDYLSQVIEQSRAPFCSQACSQACSQVCSQVCEQAPAPRRSAA